MSAPTGGGSRAQLARLLALVPYVHSREEVRVEDAAAVLGVKPGQVVKDLNVLFMCGLPGGYPDDLIDIDFEALEAGGDRVIRVSNADYLARPLRLTPTEASALIVALRVLRDTAEEETARIVDRALAKLEIAAATDDPARVEVGDVTGGEAGDPTVRATLEEALARGRQVRLTYFVPARDEESDRVVDPHRLLSSGGATYLHAWCHRAEAPRFFRLDRIHSVEATDDPVVTPPAAQPDLSEGFFASAPDAATVVLRLAPAAAWVPEYYACEAVRRFRDGSVEVTLRVGDPRWLERLVLRLAPHASIVRPPQFADSFAATARSALALYE